MTHGLIMLHITDELVERCAKRSFEAQLEADRYRWTSPVTWETAIPEARDIYRTMARAVLTEAIRSPR